MKVGDLVRRGKMYKEFFRQETALVIETRGDHPHSIGRGPVVKLVWTGVRDPEHNFQWYPCDLMELVQ